MTGFIPFSKFNFSIPFFTLALLLEENIKENFVINLIYGKFGFFGLIFSYIVIVSLCKEAKEYLVELIVLMVSVTFLTIGLGGMLKIIPLKELNLPNIPIGIFWCLGFLCYSETLLSLTQERKKINKKLEKYVRNKDSESFRDVVKAFTEKGKK